MAVVGYVKRKNVFDIMRCVKFYGPITKSDIVKRTGLTAGTVNTFINHLMKYGIIAETGIASPTGGRKAMLYSFNPKSFYIIGVSISIEKVSVALFSINLNVISLVEDMFNIAEYTVDDGFQRIMNSIMHVVNNSGVDRERILGIGVSVPGPVDYQRGVILEMPHASRWKNVPLKTMIQDKIGINVVIDNDNNSNVLCLKWENPQYSSGSLIYLSSVEGIGVGILLNGNVYRGSRFLAGEIGHVSINPEGEKCSCGNNGCIELYASNLGIVHKVKKMLQNGDASSLTDLCGGDIEKIGMPMIIDAARSGDALSVGVLEKASMYLSLCIDYIIKSFDPDIIMVDSGWLPQFQDIKNRLIESIFMRTDFVKRDDIRIEIGSIEKLFVKGAAALILEENFSEESMEKAFWLDTVSK